MRVVVLWSACTVLAGCASTPSPRDVSPGAPATSATDGGTAGPSGFNATDPIFRLPADVHPVGERVAVTVVPDREDFEGQVEISLDLDSPRLDLWVSAVELHFRKAVLRTPTGELPARVEPDAARSAARVTWSGSPVSGRATLVLDFTGRYDSRLVGLYRLRTRSGWAAYTQFEFIDARRAFPCFDEPGFKIPWDLELTIPAGETAAANTAPVAEVQIDAGLKRVRFGTTRPLPSYLVAFAVGDFDVVSPAPLPADAVRSRPLQIRGIAPRGRGAELAYGLESGMALLRGLEGWLGIPFPYEKLDHVAVPDFAFGAMENAGLITYAEALLLHREGQASELERLNTARVMTHEMAHHWFGDLVTPRWWDDLWLNESFASFMEAEVVGPWNPALEADVERVEEALLAMRNDELEGSRPIRPVLRTEADLRAWDPASIYPKGAGVMAMFQNLLGRDVFRKRLAQYLESHRDGTATTEDLVAALAGPGQDIGPALLGFVDQPGVPLVRGELRCDGSGVRIALHQERALPRGSTAPQLRWQVPVCARTDRDRKARCTLLTDVDGAIAVPGRCPRWVHLNAGAKGYYRWLLPPSGMDALLRRGWAALDPAERLSTGDALLSSAQDGAIPAAEAFARIRALAREHESAVPERTMRFLTFTRFNWSSPETDPALQRFMRAQFRPVLARLGWATHEGESARVRKLRSDVIKLLALEAADPEVLARAAQLGRAWVGKDGRVHPEAVDPDLRDVAIRAAARTGGEAEYETMASRLSASDDATVRRALALGLGSFLQPELAERARALTISPTLRLWERFSILFPQAFTPELRKGFTEWLVTHQEQLAGLMAEADKQIIAELVNGCSAEEAARVSTDFAPLARSAAGLPFQLRKVEERVRLCGAAREVQAPSMAGYLARQRHPVEQPPAPR
jgi:alanyl aminopeptidase